MAGNYNKVFLVGRLGRDPELRYTPNGTPVANFPLATDEYYNDRDGNRQQKTEWHRVVVWNKQAESASNYIKKGSQVLVEGSLQTRKWQDQQGIDRYTTEIKAQRVVFMDSASQASQQPNQSKPPQQTQSQSQPRQDDPFASYEPTQQDDPQTSVIDDAPF